MLDKCWTECSNGFTAIQNFRQQRKCCMDVEWKFKPISIWFNTLSLSFQHILRFQQCWTTCSTPPAFGSTKCWTHVESNVETVGTGLYGTKHVRQSDGVMRREVALRRTAWTPDLEKVYFPNHKCEHGTLYVPYMTDLVAIERIWLL